jgi:signal peptidase I
MTNNHDYEETKLDKILLILRRIFLILFIFLFVRIILFKILKINDSKKLGDHDIIKTKTWNIVNEELGDNKLWNNYSIDGENILYKWEIVKFADPKSFRVIIKNEINGTVINSNNLLKIFADYETRVSLMKNIDTIITNKENVINELKNSSENGMYKMKNEYDVLSQFDWWDRYEMTNEQRAKFAIMFLYIKIIKKQSNDNVTMSKALSELKIFLENFDKKNLKKEIEDKELSKIKWDLWIDDNCLYVNGELYACFLDELFVR